MGLLASADTPKAPDFIGPAMHGLVHGLLAAWPLLLLIGLAGAVKLAWKARQKHRLSQSGIAEIDRMDGRTFEVYLSTLFRRLGYQVELTHARGDYGADLVITRDGHHTAVQAKRWSKRVGVKAVQEAVASKGMYGCDQALVVANREFTQQAQKLARANQVELWDRSRLVEKLLAAQENGAQRAQVAFDEPEAVRPALTDSPTLSATAAAPHAATATQVVAQEEPATCVTCGAVVSVKVRAYCLEHSQRFGGRIYCFQHQRRVRATALAE